MSLIFLAKSGSGGTRADQVMGVKISRLDYRWHFYGSGFLPSVGIYVLRRRWSSVRVADHTDEGSAGDSQKATLLNDNVLYHSLLGLARGKTFRVELRTRGRRSGRNPSEPYPRIG